MPKFTIGSHDKSYLSLSTRDDEKQQFKKVDYFKCLISYHMDGWKGEIPSSLDLADLEEFQNQLKVLNETLKGYAELSNLENNLKVIIETNHLGHMSVSGFFLNPSHINKLEFEFNSDQTTLRQTINQVEQFIQQV